MKTELTQEQKRIKIAEACGFSEISIAMYDMNHVLRGGMHGKINGELDELPDYFNDLNAMHEAAWSLDIVSRRVFAEQLAKVCDNELPGNVLGDAFVIENATAAQRAEAFGKTLGLW